MAAMVTPCIYLSFDGRCEAAFRFYEQCFGGKITALMTWGDSPMGKDAPQEWATKVLHASLSVGDVLVAGGDPPPAAYVRPQGFSVLLGLSDPLEAERIFAALAEEGTVSVPLQQTFWASRHGWVTDRFGIPWTINCESNGERS
jgi:PhnB protein